MLATGLGSDGVKISLNSASHAIHLMRRNNVMSLCELLPLTLGAFCAFPGTRGQPENSMTGDTWHLCNVNH